MGCLMCGKELESGRKKYCSNNCSSLHCYHRNKKLKGKNVKKIRFVCKNDFCKDDVIITEHIYIRFNDDQCSNCRKYKKDCEICGTTHNKQGRTCSSECAWVIKKESYMKSCGTEHNLCRDSSSRKEMEKKLMKEYGVSNVFEREDVKEKIKESLLVKYGVDNPSKSLEILNKKLLTMISNNITVPLDQKDDFDIYRRNCLSFTLFNLNRYGNKKFGRNWEEKRGINKKHIDHIISMKEGFENNISPEITGSICNLQLIDSSINLSKGSDSWMEIKELEKNFNILRENDMEYDILLLEKIDKNNKYFYNEN